MQQTQPDRGIPHFGLYGESSTNRDPGFVHIEDIAARSRDTGWLIKPHRHGNLFQILCVYKGRLAVQLDDQKHTLAGGCAITIPPGVVHGFRFQPDTEGAVLTLAESLLADIVSQRTRRYFDELARSAQTIEFPERNGLFRRLRNCLNMISAELQQAETGYQQMLEWQVKMVLMMLKRQFDNRRFMTSVSQPHSKLMASFRTLVENNFRRQWTVQQYATSLHTSVSSLNRHCNEYLGTSAKSVIRNRILTEVKRKLIYTQYPLARIAYTLGFKDPAYFSRFFKKLEGVPPNEFRRKYNNGLQFRQWRAHKPGV